jgi:sensor histidine kinase YesM
MEYMEFIVFAHLVIFLLSLVVFILLLHKYFSDRHSHPNVSKLTKTLSLLAFFIALDSLFFCLSYWGTIGLNPLITSFFSEKGAQLFSGFGVFLSLISLAYFLLEKNIETFRESEEELKKLQDLNKQLEIRAKEIEISQEMQQKKILELEKFNEVAKDREIKMMEIIKKIEKVETKMKGKGDA